MTTDNACTQRPFDREALGRRALELHSMKYNCAQAVACTLAPLIGADEELCFRAAEGLGGGMGQCAPHIAGADKADFHNVIPPCGNCGAFAP